MVGKLEAEEALACIDTMGVATKAIKGDDARRIIRQYQENARGRPQTAGKQSPQMLGAMGIKLTVEKA